MSKPKEIDELEDLCDYCLTPFGHSVETLCEDSCCEKAYQKYLDLWEDDDEATPE